MKESFLMIRIITIIVGFSNHLPSLTLTFFLISWIFVGDNFYTQIFVADWDVAVPSLINIDTIARILHAKWTGQKNVFGNDKTQ